MPKKLHELSRCLNDTAFNSTQASESERSLNSNEQSLNRSERSLSGVETKENGASAPLSHLVPQLRFPEFEGAWMEKRTKEIAPLQRGFDLPTSDVIEGEYPIVYSNGILRHHTEYKVKAPGIVTGRSGTIGKVSYVEQNFWPHNTSLWVTNFNNNNPKFIYYFYLVFKLNRYNAGSTVPTLNRNDVHFVKKRIPTLPEQTRIANFLTAVDKRINLLQKKKAELELYKKSIMQKLFSQQIRFKQPDSSNFPDWQEKMLGEIGSTFNGLSGKSKEDFGEGKPFIKYMQIFSESKINVAGCGLVKLKSDENQNKAKYGDVFFTTSSETPKEIGTSSVLVDEVKEVYLNSFCFGYRPNSLEVLEPTFSQFFFRSSLVRKGIIKLAQGSTRYNMSKVGFMKLRFFLPIKEEQQKIASFLSSIDKKIELTKTQIEQSKTWKKGLLQKMFV